MKIKLIAFSLVFLFSLSLVSMIPITTEYTPTTLENPTMSDATMLADGEEEYFVVPIFEDETVTSSLPDSNNHFSQHRGGLFVGHEWSSQISRSWLKFNLANLPEGVVPIEAVLAIHMNDDWNDTVDAPIGVHYSSNDTWSETAITWNNQPLFSAAATDVYGESPAPDLFVQENWYEWDVTNDVA
ncbi:MAG: DNRLRE domain-containing protein, partial [Candidatus Thorarchaeota archaeon]